jgi:hypothetical protein
MYGNVLKEQAKNLSFTSTSKYAAIQKLILDGFFDKPVSSEEVVRAIVETSGQRWSTSYVQTYMRKFLEAGIIRGVKFAGNACNYWVISSVTKEEALVSIGKKRRVREIEEQIFSRHLLAKMGKDFSQELNELHFNFGRNGLSTAFLLRKILEKLIIIAMAKNGKGALLEDKNQPGGWVGLRTMIEIAAREKFEGAPFLTPKTAGETKGIKFLGDAAAHNPLAGVDNAAILPQMPFIITAYEELSRLL